MTPEHGLKLLSCAIQEDGTYTVIILDKQTNMSRVYDGCKFQELRFQTSAGDNLELGIQVLGLRNDYGYTTLAGSTPGGVHGIRDQDD